MTNVSRRIFVAGATLAGVTAAAGASASYASEAGGRMWDKEADVVVVGAGAGGLAAASICAAAGAHVAVLEVMDSIMGSNSSLCAGMIQGCCTSVQKEAGVEDSVDEYDKLLEALGEGAEKPELRRLFAENCGETIDWLIAQGIAFDPANLGTTGTMGKFYTDVTPEVPRMHVVSSWSGAEITQTLADAAAADGAEFLFSTEATRLIVEGGAVVGVEAVDADGNPIALKANAAVLMNSGGFSRNKEVLQSLMTPVLPDLFHDRPLLASYGSAYQKGTGTLMCMAAGAGIHSPFLAYQFAPGVAANPDTNSGGFIATPGIYVNLGGERFMNESRNAATPERQMGQIWRQEQGYGWALWDQTGVDGAPVHFISQDFSVEVDAGYMFRADTIEGLAEQIGVDPQVLAETVATYNEGVASGNDAFDRTDGTALETAPYYAGRLIGVSPDTAGGVTVNTDLQVVDALGEVIPHLYAVGNMVGGFKGKVCVGCGQAIGWSYTSGRLAAKTIIEQELGA